MIQARENIGERPEFMCSCCFAIFEALRIVERALPPNYGKDDGQKVMIDDLRLGPDSNRRCPRALQRKKQVDIVWARSIRSRVGGKERLELSEMGERKLWMTVDAH
jgi:hypothetical protein